MIKIELEPNYFSHLVEKCDFLKELEKYDEAIEWLN